MTDTNSNKEEREISEHELRRLEDEAIDGIDLSPDDALRVFDYLHKLEALLKAAPNAD